ncbi:hypothetical protein DUI87_07405 [Hirundo rustica rustica]|uniref:Uncharacterized protein n=1 Tax=Hirundo rustica rustica TaxID=333673 RepID=A0A3M0KRF8_HIRRU|nr:hypothetical protein DUI87_07405 [Hirundo rustica rustica]
MSGGWWKANNTLIFKYGKKEEKGNYWPISIASTPGKVMEHLYLEAISINMDDKKVIRSSRDGFTKGIYSLQLSSVLLSFVMLTVATFKPRKTASRSPGSLLFFKLNNPNSQPVFKEEMLQSLITFTASSGPTQMGPCLPHTGGPRTEDSTQ